jgi:hypothetical protein
MTTYKIVRFYQRHPNEVLQGGLTLEEAQAHCEDPETSSGSCTSAEGKERTAQYGAWFDGYREE